MNQRGSRFATLVVLGTLILLSTESRTFGDNPPTNGPQPACLPGQKPGVDCPAPPLGNGQPATSQPGGSVAPGTPTSPGPSGTPAPPTGPNVPLSGFKSTAPADRSISFFGNLKDLTPTTMKNFYAVSWDSSSRIQYLPYISVEKNIQGTGFRDQHLCTSLDDPSCAPEKGWDFAFISSTIGNCAVNPDSACVSKFEIVQPDGKVITAKPLTKFPANYTEFGGGKLASGSYLAPGLTPWIWRAEGDAPGNEHDYLLMGLIQSAAQKSSISQGNSNKWNPIPSVFYFEVVPVSHEMSSLIKAPYRSETKLKSNSNGVEYSQLSTNYMEDTCFANDIGVCLHRRDFPTDSRMRLSLQVPHNVSGWLNGRLFNPIATLTSKNENLDLLTIEAGPTKNIMTGGYVPVSSITQSDWSWMNQIQGPSTSVLSANNLKSGDSNFYVGESGESGALEWYQAWSKYFGDKALRVNTTWTVQTTRSESTGGCVKPNSGLQGIVSTNSAVYDSGAPTQDKATNTLKYKVAAPVNDPNGVPNVGVYALSMNSTLLKCLYSIDAIPSQAQIVITQVDGSSVVQTASIKTDNNWVNFAANNFNFSDLSLLQVKISSSSTSKTPTPTPSSTQTNNSVAVPKANPSKSPVLNVNKTITCIKGKLTKKVSGINPSCPAGYTKK